VIVLDDQHVRVAPQHGAELRGAFGGQARASRILRARGADHGSRPGRERLLEPKRGHPRLLHGHRNRAEAVQAQRADVRQKARILDGDRIAAREMHGKQPLDRVHRAVGHHDPKSASDLLREALARPSS
jgi:hypothetical protein